MAGETRPDAAVVVEKLSKHYAGPPPVDAVKGIDLEVARGEIFGLLGPNGAGKTTTVGMCTTRVVPTAGRVTRRRGRRPGAIRPGPGAGSGW